MLGDLLKNHVDFSRYILYAQKQNTILRPRRVLMVWVQSLLGFFFPINMNLKWRWRYRANFDLQHSRRESLLQNTTSPLAWLRRPTSWEKVVEEWARSKNTHHLCVKTWTGNELFGSTTHIEICSDNFISCSYEFGQR